MICRACGFETPEAQGYCDFCKEPFPKRETSGPAAGPSKARSLDELDEEGLRPPGGKALLSPKKPPPERVKLSPDVMMKLMRVKDAASRSPSGPAEIPPEFTHLDAGEKIPEVPPAARKLAWVFLGVLMFWILAGTVWMLKNSDRIAANAGREPARAVAP